MVTAGFVLSGSFKEIDALAFLPIDVTLILAAVVAVLVALRLISEPVPRAVHTVFFGFLLLLPAAFFTAATEYGAYKEQRLFTITLLSILAPVVLIRDWPDVRKHLIALAGVAGIVVVGALINPQSWGNYAGAPITTESVDTIGLGTAAAVVVVIMTMGLMWRGIPWQIALPADCVAVYVLLQSGSRGPLFSTAVAILVGAFLVRVRPPLRRSLFFVVLFGVGVLVAFNLAPFYSQQRILDLLTGDTVGSVDNRVGLIDVGIDVISRHPLGVGWGGFEAEAFSGYTYPHDLPVEVLAEAGLVLGGIFLAWLAFWVARAHRPTVDFIGGTVFAVLVCVLGKSLVSGDLNDNRLTFYGLGIVVAAYRLHRQRLAAAPGDHASSRSLTLPEYGDVLRAHRRVITASVLLGILAGVVVTLSTPPRYQAEVTLYVAAHPTQADGSDVREGTELAAARIPTYVEVITSERIAREVAGALGPDVSPADIADEISARNTQDTMLISTTVTDSSPERAAWIANLAADLAVESVSRLEQPSGPLVRPAVTMQVFEPAEVPTAPVSPRPRVNLFLGGLLGLLSGLGLALVRDRTDASVKSRQQVRTITGVPVLGEIDADPAIARTPVIVQQYPLSPSAEAFRQLRANLRLPDVTRPVWVVTSPTPGDGKTTTVGNLATVIADAGGRVLVIEGDLRLPRIAEHLKADRTVGLTNVLVDAMPEGQAIHHVRAGLDLLASGPLRPNPGDLLASAAMDGLLMRVRASYDVVLVDASPLAPVADAVVLTRHADGVLLVVPYGGVKCEQLEVAREALDAASAPLVGAVLNKVPPHRKSGYLQEDQARPVTNSTKQGSGASTKASMPSA